ncbi:hypothetical protein [Streptomyces sp. JJ38]|uniref:hypothetical protein n=1 Tax=Streptomyces sp. JJ38 TaxID=2738128 RepID=UPI001C57CFCE|nr:hypothetical protein [Streptomyces sp. JJ38]MBW1597930.1 hypothetical protein [Streptomyces sp. JJ38]
MITSDVGPEELVTYLSRTGWTRTRAGALAELWQASDDTEISVLVPRHAEAEDFKRTLGVFTSEVARYERRKPEDVHRDIARQFLDVTDLRAADDDITESTISLQAGMSLFNSANRLMVSAAAATIQRQGYYGRSMPKAAHAHARRLRLGQTRPGSYVIPIISSARFGYPIQTEEKVPRLHVESEESYFDRRVLATLSRSLETLAEMTMIRELAPSRDEVIDSVDEGVSTELCRAVLEVIGAGGISAFDVSFKWATASPSPGNLRDQIKFTQEQATLIEEVGEELKGVEKPSETVLYGVIRKMSLRKNEQIGRVTLETLIAGRPRSVSFDLDLDTYRRAARYHGERRRVVVTGILDTPPGRPATMKVKGFGPDRSVLTLDEVEQL